MIVFGSPFGKKHIIRVASDLIRSVVHRIKPRPMVKIHFIYFSCATDFGLLSMSLRSLRVHGGDSVGNIYVIEDKKGTFSCDQKTELKKIFHGIEFICLGNIDWASIDTLKTEISAFGIIAKKVDSNAFIAKVDSDILFFSKIKLNEISVCSYDFVGDGHYSDYKYAQGGLYFLRASLASVLASNTSDNDLEKAIQQCGTIAEDQVISSLVRLYAKKIWLARIMLFPNEYDKVDLNNFLVRHEFSSIHFVHKKSDMLSFFKKLEVV